MKGKSAVLGATVGKLSIAPDDIFSFRGTGPPVNLRLVLELR